jgi:hypothetical protein
MSQSFRTERATWDNGKKCVRLVSHIQASLQQGMPISTVPVTVHPVLCFYSSVRMNRTSPQSTISSEPTSKTAFGTEPASALKSRYSVSTFFIRSIPRPTRREPVRTRCCRNKDTDTRHDSSSDRPHTPRFNHTKHARSNHHGATHLSLYPRSIDDFYEWRSVRRWYKAMRKGAGKSSVWEKRYNMCYSTRLWRKEWLLDLASAIAPGPWLLNDIWLVIVSGVDAATCNGTGKSDIWKKHSNSFCTCA